MSALEGREILLGVSGGIACYKSVELLRGLKRAGAEVQVVMTSNARRFVAPLTFQTLSNRAVGQELFELDRENRIGHIAMAHRAELALVAPCTANIMAKLRAGICDDLLTTILLAATAPLYLAPAMNEHMLAHPATRENLEVLESRGVRVIAPGVGFLAEGGEGPGRMAEPEEIVAAVASHFSSDEGAPAGRKPLAGRRVLITAGPTIEPIDPVRFLSNRSSGRMGFAMAEVCLEAGAEVTLVSGPVRLPDPAGVTMVKVTTAGEMGRAVLERLPAQDVMILAAAVSDYRMSEVHTSKLKRAGREKLTLELEANADIAAEVGRRKTKEQLLVIFAAETEELLANATRKMAAKGAEMVVANDITLPGAGFDSTRNSVTMLFREPDGGEQPRRRDLPLMEKHAVAGHVVDQLVELLTRRD